MNVVFELANAMIDKAERDLDDRDSEITKLTQKLERTEMYLREAELKLNPRSAPTYETLYKADVFGAEMWVTYEYEAEQKESEIDPSYPASAIVLSVWVDGQWLCAEDVLSAGLISQIEDEIVRGMVE